MLEVPIAPVVRCRGGLKREICRVLVLSLLLVAMINLIAHWRFGSLKNAAHALSGRRMVVSSVGAGFGPDGRYHLRYKVRNLSGHPIRLLGSRSSCSCASATALPLTIPSHDEVELEIFVNTIGGPTEQRGSMVVFTSEAGREALQIPYVVESPLAR